MRSGSAWAMRMKGVIWLWGMMATRPLLQSLHRWQGGRLLSRQSWVSAGVPCKNTRPLTVGTDRERAPPVPSLWRGTYLMLLCMKQGRPSWRSCSSTARTRWLCTKIQHQPVAGALSWWSGELDLVYDFIAGPACGAGSACCLPCNVRVLPSGRQQCVCGAAEREFVLSSVINSLLHYVVSCGWAEIGCRCNLCSPIRIGPVTCHWR